MTRSLGPASGVGRKLALLLGQQTPGVCPRGSLQRKQTGATKNNLVLGTLLPSLAPASPSGCGEGAGEGAGEGEGEGAGALGSAAVSHPSVLFGSLLPTSITQN